MSGLGLVTNATVLHQGEYAFASKGATLKTLLGSCVAITFWHPASQTGAMCHYLLPERPINQAAAKSGRYAEEVIAIIARHFQQRGIPPSAVVVQMFGGGSMFHDLRGDAQRTIGESNIRAGRQILREHGFRIAHECLAGASGRQIRFDLTAGDASVAFTGRMKQEKPLFKHRAERRNP